MTSFVWDRVARNPWFFATLIFNNFQLFYGAGYFSCNILIFMYLFCVPDRTHSPLNHPKTTVAKNHGLWYTPTKRKNAVKKGKQNEKQ